MLNKEVFVLNPDQKNLINDGYVTLNTNAADAGGQKIIRHEIQTFVCEGEYFRGLQRMLQTYLTNFDQPKQPSVWVSGFFGSGKSHLVKMLSYFWENFSFSDGVTARQLKPLPTDLDELFVEMARKQDLHGSIVVKGLLSDFAASDVRYAFLQLMLSNLKLPTSLNQFRFYFWIRSIGILDQLKEKLNCRGTTLEEEMENLYVAQELYPALLELLPDQADTAAQLREQIGQNFPETDRISKTDFLYVIKNQILPLFSKTIPCILVALDEVQQYIGQDENKATQIQFLAEDLNENFNGRLLLVATGQNALTETPMLQKLTDRYIVKVALSDQDVDTVTRKTVLEKKSSAVTPVSKKLEDALGEISSLLEGTDYGFVQEDKKMLVADYPILPATRKFWKKVLQAVDSAGTSGQLRSQLRIIDESIKSVAQNKLGEIIPADFIFEQKKQQLLLNARLLNEQSNIISDVEAKGGDNMLKARILKVVFLIDLLPKDSPKYKLKSDKKTIADLLISDLNASSDHFRNNISQLTDELVNDDKYLIPIDDEYKLQTRVGAEWEKEFTIQANKFRNDEQKLYEIRTSKIVQTLSDKLKTTFVSQGNSKLRRDFVLYHGEAKPKIQEKLNLWLRDGWLENENTLMDEVLAQGTDEPLAYLFVRKVYDQELKREMIKFLAANGALEEKGHPSTPEGIQARKSMETRRTTAQKTMTTIVENICNDIKVILAGGSLIDVADLATNVRNAMEAVAARQFPDFKKADYPDWDKALKKAMNNDTQALQAIGYNHEPKDHPMASELFNFMGYGGKPGKDIRSNFAGSPFGWSQDAVDAMLVTLKITGNISTPETNLNQRSIPQATFKAEAITLTAKQKIEIRKLYQVAGINCQSGNELKCSTEFLRYLDDLARQTYGDAPLPEFVDKQLIADIMNLEGNEKLLSVHKNADTLEAKCKQWKQQAETIQKRLPGWELLVSLNRFANDGEEISNIREQINAIRTERMILHEPDPVQTPLAKLTEWLRKELNRLKQQYNDIYDARMPQLQENEYFSKLEPDQKHEILVKYQLLAKPEMKSYDAGQLLAQLNNVSLEAWNDKVTALPGKFQNAVEDAIQLSAPRAESYTLPKRTIRNEQELESYLNQLHAHIKGLLNNGEVILK